MAPGHVEEGAAEEGAGPPQAEREHDRLAGEQPRAGAAEAAARKPAGTSAMISHRRTSSPRPSAEPD